jgi:hypothetical protein
MRPVLGTIPFMAEKIILSFRETSNFLSSLSRKADGMEVIAGAKLQFALGYATEIANADLVQRHNRAARIRGALA